MKISLAIPSIPIQQATINMFIFQCDVMSVRPTSFQWFLQRFVSVLKDVNFLSADWKAPKFKRSLYSQCSVAVWLWQSERHEVLHSLPLFVFRLSQPRRTGETEQDPAMCGYRLPRWMLSWGRLVLLSWWNLLRCYCCWLSLYYKARQDFVSRTILTFVLIWRK